MEHPVCVACAVQFGDDPPAVCPICADARQFVPPGGQRWTTVAALALEHRTELRDQGPFLGVGSSPAIGIGQRALLVPHADANLLWDCVTLLDEAAVAAIERRGGLSAIAISHPHYHGAMVDLARRFGCPVHVHAADRRWVMRPDPVVSFWDGETLDLGHGRTLLRLGGHFAGGTVLHLAEGDGALLSGDIVQVVPDRTHVAFMWSYPNYVPLPAASVADIAARLRDRAFGAIHGAWWDSTIPADGAAIVQRSAARYAAALRGELL